MSEFSLTQAQKDAYALLSSKKYTLLFGGSRCISGDTRVLTDKGYVPVRELYFNQMPFTVAGYDEDIDAMVWTMAEVPFIKGVALLYKVTTTAGMSFRCTENHRILTKDGYKELKDVVVGETLIGTPWYDLPRIQSIEPTTIEPYYDFTVPKTSNYVAEGVVHHNSGKSFALVSAVFSRAIKEPESRHLILRFRFNHAYQSLMCDTIPKVLKIAWPQLTVQVNKKYAVYTLPNKSEVWIGGMDDGERVERILGNEYSTIWFEECSQLSWKGINVVRTRLAQKNNLEKKIYFSCNPPSKRHWVYQVFVQGINPEDGLPLKDAENYGCLRMNPDQNLSNIDGSYMDILQGLTEKERKRFLMGEFSDDSEGALFKYDWIVKNRVLKQPDRLDRVGVGVDPAVTALENSDLTGIICGGIVNKGSDGRKHFYIWDDFSIKASPATWASEVSRAYSTYMADFTVAEINQGGDMVTSTLYNADPLMNVRIVRATRGKQVRAEPVAALAEKGQLHIVGELPELENEMTGWNPLTDDKSPDRLDAMVWLISELMGKNARVGTW
jgi:phage terminase large subunit-like protein